jgi:hypothetical protein
MTTREPGATDGAGREWAIAIPHRTSKCARFPTISDVLRGTAFTCAVSPENEAIALPDFCTVKTQRSQSPYSVQTHMHAENAR